MNDNKSNWLNRRDVQAITRIPCASIYALMNHPDPEIRFPRAFKIGESRVRWSEKEVRDWMARHEARRDAAA